MCKPATAVPRSSVCMYAVRSTHGVRSVACSILLEHDRAKLRGLCTQKPTTVDSLNLPRTFRDIAVAFARANEHLSQTQPDLPLTIHVSDLPSCPSTIACFLLGSSNTAWRARLNVAASRSCLSWTTPSATSEFPLPAPLRCGVTMCLCQPLSPFFAVVGVLHLHIVRTHI